MPKSEIGVLGGAVAGSLVALAFLEETKVAGADAPIVHLFDQNEKLLGKKSTSSNQCFKLHSGMHYLNNLETAKKCLLASIEFARTHPDCIFQKDSAIPPENELKYQDRKPGHFYIVKSSAVGMDDRVENDGSTTKGARYIAKELTQLYKQMIEKDSANEVFGPWQEFIREIPLGQDKTAPEYIDYTDKKKKRSIRTLEGAFEVREAQIDINKFRDKLERKLKVYEDSGQLQIHYSTKVKSLTLDPDSLGYEVKVSNVNNSAEVIPPYKFKAVANCTWKDMLDVEQGLQTKIGQAEGQGIDVRGKISLLVQLPEGFEDFTTRIFASGGYCSITMVDFEKRHAVLTFSPISDLEEYKAGQEKLPQWVYDLNPDELKPDSEPGKYYAKEIVQGCAGFIPRKNGLRQTFIDKTKVLEVRLAHVCSREPDIQNYDLENPNSPIHSRLESGIEQRLLGVVRYACIKMTYGPQAAKEVTKILLQHLDVMKNIEHGFANHALLGDKSLDKQPLRQKFLLRIRKSLNEFVAMAQAEKDDEQLSQIIQPIISFIVRPSSASSYLLRTSPEATSLTLQPPQNANVAEGAGSTPPVESSTLYQI